MTSCGASSPARTCLQTAHTRTENWSGWWTAPRHRSIKMHVDSPAAKPSVIVVMGVSGSGKSTIAAMLAHRLHWIYEDADWFHPPQNVAKMHSGVPLTDADRGPWLNAIATWIDN